MTIMQCIDDYVNKAVARIPIYTNEIYDYVCSKLPNTEKATFNMTLQRYAKKRDDFLRYQKGIYYKTFQTPFGTAGIDMMALIRKTYLLKGNEVIGYESGPSYMNKLGLTTQMPKLTYIVTQKARFNTEKTDELFLVKPTVKITDENYRYLQFLDVLDNKMQVPIEAVNYKEILRKQIGAYNLSFEKLIGYAKYYKNTKVYQGLSEIARGVD